MKRGPFDLFGHPGAGHPQQQTSDFDQFEATELYCPECGYAVPVKKSLLLILPDGDKYEYRCQNCECKVGEKMDRPGQFQGILKA